MLDACDFKDLGKSGTYSIRHLLHLNFVAGTNCTLVVAKNSDLSVAIIVELNFLLDGDVGVLELFQQR